MIPKVIHYCQFGRKPLNRLSKHCLASWKKYLPDYQIKEWNESNFDVNICDFTKEAYNAKNYAYVSDYARFWILYHHGGLYFDTDVEVLKPLDTILSEGPFMGCEESADTCSSPLDLHVNPGIGIAAYPHMSFIRDMLAHYQDLHYMDANGKRIAKTIVIQTTEQLVQRGLILTRKNQECSGFKIYPHDYFCPKNYNTGKTRITSNTVTIHHFNSSWLTPYELWFQWMIRHMPNTLVLIKKVYSFFAYRK